MRLKTLEIKGFKSFADKTVVHFDDNITGIVGPNGCGKSNIVDSIRWVIGEQKISQLRSENLESLVFNGSKTRSASGLAEVSLTFENTKNLLPTEFNTVTITRKFYKNGESEYRLNDVQCRLKDIQNLFMDTGVSTDSYAIIELGMVDDLIKDKDNSRRRMLEQAAGISIYKTRKKEARQKLDATEMDLSRIDDLLFEINNQLKALESQAKKAEKYHEIKKDYRTVSIELAKASIEGFNHTYKSLTENLESETDKKIQLEAIIASGEAELEKEKLVFIENEKSLQALQHEYNDLSQSVRTKESDKNLSAQKLEHLTEKAGSLTGFLANSENQLTGIEESIVFSTGQLSEEETKLSEVTEKLAILKREADEKREIFNEKRGTLDELRREHQQIQRQQFELEKKLAIAETSIQNLTRSIQQLEEEQQQRISGAANLDEEKVIVEQDISTKSTELQQLQQHQDRTKEQILQAQSVLEEMRQELTEENRILDAKVNEHDLLKSMIDSMEGYPESVKFLHNNTGWNHQSPILSDVIYVNEAYRTALENVLEPYLSYYVVENSAEGFAAIRLLDENKKGKANFFLLDAINAYAGNIETNANGATSALSVIEVDEKYRHLAHYLLKDVYILEEGTDAPVENDGKIWIAKSGKFVKGKVTLTGGSVGLIEGKKIGRAKNLEKLAADIQQQKNTTEQLKESIRQKHNEVIAYNEDLRENAIKEAEKQLQQLNNRLFGLQNKIDNLQQQQVVSQKRIEDLVAQLQTAEEAAATQRTELSAIAETFNVNANTLNEAEEMFKVMENAFNEANQLYNEANLNLSKQQSRIASIKQELEFKTRQLEELKIQITANSRSLEETNVAIDDVKSALALINEQLVMLTKEKAEKEDIVNKADQAYYNLRNILSEKESSLRQKSREKEQSEHLTIALKDKLNELKLQLAGTKERLNVEFKIQLEDIMEEERTSEATMEELSEKAERMKKRLENLGEVNPMAIEAFTEMKKRYEFIIEQKNDLVTAKQSLLQTIEEVEATANQKFLETFNSVKENFKKVFQTLFTDDDHCDLVLEKPDNLAETGIEVIARPKGKRPTSLTQLSGGERTLTATALLFAIYLIKPAPFCILDEVDAPLDDANVGKFTNMIRQFSDNSQFIIVTHNKTTMSTVDVIYGVTMQEPGVSKLVSVDFRNLSPN